MRARRRLARARLSPFTVARADWEAGRYSTLRVERLEGGYWYVCHRVERPLHAARPDGPQALVSETLAGPFASASAADKVLNGARKRAER
jgi:hypothetical protein